MLNAYQSIDFIVSQGQGRCAPFGELDYPCLHFAGANVQVDEQRRGKCAHIDMVVAIITDAA